MPAPLTATTPNDHEVVVTRIFDAPADLVFRAHTEPKLVKRWLLGPPGWTMPTCEIDLRVGGKFRYGWAKHGAQGFEIIGVYREIERPNRIVHNEEMPWASERVGGGGEPALVTTVFKEARGKTSMTLTMAFPSQAVRDAAVATGMTDGMEQSYRNLDQLVASSAAA